MSPRRPGRDSDRRAVRRVRHDPGSTVDTSRWPATVPAIGQLLGEGLELPAGLTVLVGENGSGKSTVMETLAEACGMNGAWRRFLADPGSYFRHLLND